MKRIQYVFVLILVSVTAEGRSPLPGLGDGPTIDDEDAVERSVDRTKDQVCRPCDSIDTSTAPNYALGKTASQSSIYKTKSASYAVDGVDSTCYDDCTHTQKEKAAWWSLDLGESTLVTDVIIINRRCPACGVRLGDFYIGVTDDPPSAVTPSPANYKVCTYYAGAFPDGGTERVSCDTPTQGRYLVIQLKGTNYLTLCEVKVYSASTPVSASLKEAWSSSGEGLIVNDEGLADAPFNKTDVCSPCQCQCDHPPPPAPTSHANDYNDLEKVGVELMAIHASLNTNTALLHAITKQVGFVQHDLESPRDTGCPDDFLFDRETNTCLQFHVDKEAERLDWAQAQRYCQHLGPKTHLAIIDTPDKLELVAKHLRQVDLPIVDNDFRRGTWIGGMRGKDGGSWFWTTTGEELSHQTGGGMWGPMEPYNGGGHDDCLSVATGPPFPDWMFNDVPCLGKLLYICERHLD